MTSTPKSRVVQLVPGGSAGASALAELRDRRDAGQRFPAPPRGELTLAGAQLLDENMAGLDLSGVDLSGAELSGADLTGARLFA